MAEEEHLEIHLTLLSNLAAVSLIASKRHLGEAAAVVPVLPGEQILKSHHQREWIDTSLLLSGPDEGEVEREARDGGARSVGLGAHIVAEAVEKERSGKEDRGP